MDKLSIPDHALLFIGFWSLDAGYCLVTDDDLTRIFPTSSNARLKNILRGLYGKGFLHRRRQKKKERVDESSEESTNDVFRTLHRMLDLLRFMKTKEEKALALARIKKFMSESLWRGQRDWKKKKKKKKRGPRCYVYSITRKGIKQCNYLIGKGYRLQENVQMTQWTDEHIDWYFRNIHV